MKNNTALKHRTEIDGLRAIAVIPVVLFHAGISFFKGGYVGVDIFFVISGYLITSLIINEIKNKKFKLSNFLLRRFKRIFPALCFVILCTIPFSIKFIPLTDLDNYFLSVISSTLFSSNFLFWLQSSYFDVVADKKPLLHTWSLGVEGQFYILFPIFLILLQKEIQKKRIQYLILSIGILSFIYCEWASRFYPVANFFLLPSRVWELCFGALAFFANQNKKNIANNFFSFIGLILILCSFFFFDETTRFPSFYTLLPILGTYLIIVHCNTFTLVGRILSLKFLVGAGLISYSLYLWHQPLFALYKVHYGILEFNSIFLLIVISFLLSLFSWKYIEIPFRNKKIISNKTNFLILINVFSLIIFISLISLSNKRFFINEFTLDNVKLINQKSTERQNKIFAGICHFNENGKYTEIKDFLINWNCVGDNKLKNNILIFGDSHGADIAMALRLNDINTFQITGAGCELVPKFVRKDRLYCRDILKKIENEIIPNYQINKIILSSIFYENSYYENYLEEILKFWSKFDVEIYLFSPMPNFELISNQFLDGKKNITISPDYKSENIFFYLLKSLNIPQNIKVIKKSNLWCSQNNQQDLAYNSFDKSNVLMIDRGHLTVEGAKIFGQRLINLQKFDILD